MFQKNITVLLMMKFISVPLNGTLMKYTNKNKNRL